MRSETFWIASRAPWARIVPTALVLALLGAGAGSASPVRQDTGGPAIAAGLAPRAPQPPSDPLSPSVAPVDESQKDKPSKAEQDKLRSELDALVKQRTDLNQRIAELRAKLHEPGVYVLKAGQALPGDTAPEVRVWSGAGADKITTPAAPNVRFWSGDTLIAPSENRKMTQEERKLAEDAMKQAREAMKLAQKALEEAQRAMPNGGRNLFFMSPGTQNGIRAYTMPALPAMPDMKAIVPRNFHFEMPNGSKDWNSQDWQKFERDYAQEWEKRRPEFERAMRDFEQRMQKWQQQFESDMRARFGTKDSTKPNQGQSSEEKDQPKENETPDTESDSDGSIF